MSDAEHSYSVDQDPHRLLTMILYVLYIVAIFSAGILAVIALIINYLKRSDVQGSIFASMTLAATLFCIAVVAISWLWMVYRAIRGLIRVNDNLPMYH